MFLGISLSKGFALALALVFLTALIILPHSTRSGPSISVVAGTSNPYGGTYAGTMNVDDPPRIDFYYWNGDVLTNSETLHFNVSMDNPIIVDKLSIGYQIWSVSITESWENPAQSHVIYHWSINNPADLSDDDPNPLTDFSYAINLTGVPQGPQQVQVNAVDGGYVSIPNYYIFSCNSSSTLNFIVSPSSTFPPSSAVNANGTAKSRAIIVPDDFSTIQEAVDNASAGDTVYVRAGTYVVGGWIGLTIDKPISLIGENCQDTIIYEEYYRYANVVVQIAADNVTFSGFKIEPQLARITVH